jgi:RND family efflux transporter MFP subunit
MLNQKIVLQSISSVRRPGDYDTRSGHAKICLRLALVGTLIALSLALLGCSKKEEAAEAATVTVQAANAQQGYISQQVTADAVLYPIEQAAIVPKVSAPVKKYYVNRGSHVKAGDLLVELENQDLIAAADDAKGAYQQAQATYNTEVKSGLPEDAQKAEGDAKAAKQALDAAQRVYDGRQTLFQQGAIPRKDLEDATVALTQARNAYELAEHHFESLKQFGNQDALKGAEGQLASAKGKYDAAQAQLSYSQIRSPIDGIVTDRPFFAGEMPAAGSPVVTVMNVSQIVARAHIAHDQAALVKLGDTATISVPGSDDVTGKTTLVSPALDPNSTTVEVWVQAANPKGELRPGTGARVTITTETVKDAIIVPAAAVMTTPDGTSVIAVSGDKPQLKGVKVGIRQGDNVQILDGIAAGDQVVTVGAFPLSQEDPDVLAKTKVQVAAPPSKDEGAGEDTDEPADNAKGSDQGKDSGGSKDKD